MWRARSAWSGEPLEPAGGERAGGGRDPAAPPRSRSPWPLEPQPGGSALARGPREAHRGHDPDARPGPRPAARGAARRPRLARHARRHRRTPRRPARGRKTSAAPLTLTSSSPAPASRAAARCSRRTAARPFLMEAYARLRAHSPPLPRGGVSDDATDPPRRNCPGCPPGARAPALAARRQAGRATVDLQRGHLHRDREGLLPGARRRGGHRALRLRGKDERPARHGRDRRVGGQPSAGLYNSIAGGMDFRSWPTRGRCVPATTSLR